MNNKMLKALAKRLEIGLMRQAINTCSKWSERYRVMGAPFPGLVNHIHHPWTKEMRDCEDELVCGQKAAQMGYTEVALDKTFYTIDIKGQSVMYILPSSGEASDFSSTRFDPALELSPHLQQLFSDVKNVGIKRAGAASLFLRGSRSRSQLKSVPAGLLILDELDEFKAENIPMIFERASGQKQKQFYMLSTPTVENFGINYYFRQSTQDHFMFPCPRCSKLTELLFPECLVITAEDWTDPKIKESYIKCKECNGRLDHEAKREWLALPAARWVPTAFNKNSRGFYINQLYSTTVRPDEFATAYLKSKTNPTDEQEFFNQKLGMTHVVEGAQITDEVLSKVIGKHRKMHTSPDHSLVTLGVDVGKFLHFEVDQWFLDERADLSSTDVNMQATCRVLMEGKVDHFEQLDELMRRYKVSYCVIDANPERRKALEFARRFDGFVRLCFYANNVNGKQLHLHAEEEHTVSVDRTAWLDLALGRFHREKIVLPMDVSLEYKSHAKALARIYERDDYGNPVGRYEKGHQDDHFAHARNYAEIALQLAAGNAVQSHNLSNIF